MGRRNGWRSILRVFEWWVGLVDLKALGGTLKSPCTILDSTVCVDLKSFPIHTEYPTKRPFLYDIRRHVLNTFRLLLDQMRYLYCENLPKPQADGSALNCEQILRGSLSIFKARGQFCGVVPLEPIMATSYKRIS